MMQLPKYNDEIFTLKKSILINSKTKHNIHIRVITFSKIFIHK